MRRRQKQQKRYLPTTRPSPADYPQHDSHHFDARTGSEDIRQQLRNTLEQLQHNRLTSDLEVQKRLLLDQQLKTSKQENQELRGEIEDLRKELTKIGKKYSKMKEKRDCEKCKKQDEVTSKLEKQRQIYNNDRKIMQDEIRTLKNQLQSVQAAQERDRLLVLTDSLYKEVNLSNKKIEQQTRIIHFLNEKLSQFQIENVEIMKKVDLLESKLSEMEIDSIMQKKAVCHSCGGHLKKRDQRDRESVTRSRARRNGSIQNIRKTERDQHGSLERYQA